MDILEIETLKILVKSSDINTLGTQISQVEVGTLEELDAQFGTISVTILAYDKNKNLVGKMNFSLLIHNEEKKNYASVFNFFASSYHYDEGLRYQVFRPALTFYFRTIKTNA